MSGLLGGWGELLAAIAVFLASHSIPARPTVRGRIVAAIGRPAYLVVYSAVSVLVLAWLIAAAARAPHVELWPREPWQTLVPVATMLPAIVLIVFALTTPNPLSVNLRRSAGFDPEHPGIAGIVRHPILWALLLWSLSHLVPNGDLAHILMFGLFAALSLAGMAMLDRRMRRTLGDGEWRTLSRRTSNMPCAALSRGWRPRVTGRDLLLLVGAVALYLALMAGHEYFAGVPIVLPW